MINNVPFLFKGIQYQSRQYKDYLLVQDNGTLTIYDTSPKTIKDVVNDGFTGNYGFDIVKTIIFYDIINDQPTTILKKRITNDYRIHDQFKVQDTQQQIYNLNTNIFSNTNLPLLGKASKNEYSYNDKTHDIVDNWMNEFQLDY